MDLIVAVGRKVVGIAAIVLAVLAAVNGFSIGAFLLATVTKQITELPSTSTGVAALALIGGVIGAVVGAALVLSAFALIAAILDIHAMLREVLRRRERGGSDAGALPDPLPVPPGRQLRADRRLGSKRGADGD